MPARAVVAWRSVSEQRRATDGIRRVGRQILALLGGSASASRGEMARAARVSPETVKRALDWLRDQGAPLRYEPKQRSWRLTKSFALPLSDPSLEDLQAVLVAAALLTELGLESAAHRAWALFNDLGTRVQDTWPRPIRDDALRATL